MNLVLTGINHRTAPLAVREKLWFSDNELPPVLARLRNRLFAECLVISTCNRTELYGFADNQTREEAEKVAHEAASALIEFKSAAGSVTPEHMYRHFDYHAAGHLFKVAGGIDSMVIGDIQILSQIKSHYTLAFSSHTTGMYLNRLVQTALRVGKRTRAETTIAEGAVSVSYVAVELASKIFSNLAERKVLLIGAGETGELTAKNLIAHGVRSIAVANRTRSKAEDLVRELGGGSIVDFEQREAAVHEMDVVISSVSGADYVLTADQVRRALRARGNSPLLLVDIGVPRNIDPAADELENVFLHDLDSLSTIVGRNLERRKAEIPAVNAIVLEELAGLRQWFESLQVKPTISELRELFEITRSDEVKKHINRFAPHDQELVELVTRRIVNKLLHLPTTNLKNGDGESVEEQHRKIHTIRGLFGLHRHDDNHDEPDSGDTH
jgi:glutamyl-tRNA reductase